MGKYIFIYFTNKGQIRILVDPPLRDRKEKQRKTEAKQYPSRWRAIRRKIPVLSQQQDKEAEKNHAESSERALWGIWQWHT